MSIVLVGGAGAPNYGDELIVNGWINYFESKFSGQNIIFYENIKSKSDQLHLVRDFKNNIQFSEDLVSVAKTVKDLSFWEQVERGYNFYKNNGFEIYKNKNLSPLLDAKILHLHGGGYLNDFGKEKGFLLGLLSSVSKITGAKLFATGIGFGPVHSEIPNKSLMVEVFNNFQIFELRDMENFRMLRREIGSHCFKYGTDDCFLKSTSDLFDINNDSTLYLSYLNYNVNKFSEGYWKELEDFKSLFSKTVFFESYPWEDAKVIDNLRGKISSFDVLPVTESINKKIQVSKDSFVISSRFHVHFIFSRFGINGLYNDDSKYYSVKHQSIKDRISNFTKSNFETINDPTLGYDQNSMCLDSMFVSNKIALADFLYEI